MPLSTLVCSNCGRRNRIRPSERGTPFCGNRGAPLPWVVDATDSTFEVESRAPPAVVIDLWAPWCGPCRFVSPILDQLAHQYAGRLKVMKVNVDENPRLARRFDARSIPTLVVIRDGAASIASSARCPGRSSTPRLRRHLKPPRTA